MAFSFKEYVKIVKISRIKFKLKIFNRLKMIEFSFVMCYQTFHYHFSLKCFFTKSEPYILTRSRPKSFQKQDLLCI